MNNIDILEEKEKKAIKSIKSELQDEKEARNDYQSLTGLYGNLEIEIILKLLETLISENKELKEENRFLKTHEYKSKCECCKEYFYHKRPNVLWCKKCRTKMYNINYYANLSEEKKRERAEKSKIAMRKKRKLQSLLGKE